MDGCRAIDSGANGKLLQPEALGMGRVNHIEANRAALASQNLAQIGGTLNGGAGS
jgi:hypothetical protein